jgi:hypothetical protein
MAGRKAGASLGRRYDLFAMRFQHSRVRLLAPEHIPKLASIHTFVRPAPSSRYLDTPVCAQIARRLSGLRMIDWGLNDNDRLYASRRRASRHALAREVGVLGRELPLLRDVRLHFFHAAPLDQHFQLPSLLAPSFPGDALSSAVGELSRNLTTLKITGVVDAQLFARPRRPSDGCSLPPSWPSLQQLVVEFHNTTPSGSWCFKESSAVGSAPPSPVYPPSTPWFSWRDDAGSMVSLDAVNFAGFPSAQRPIDPLSLAGPGPDFCDEEEERRLLGFWPVNIFRVVPDDTMLRPFLMAFATAAVSEMPSLVEARIATQVEFPDGTQQPWSITWLAPGESDVAASTDTPAWTAELTARKEHSGLLRRRRLRFQVGAWQPDEELLATLRAVGRSRFGDELDEVFA